MFAREFREDVDDRLPLDAQPTSPTAAHFGAGDIGWTALGPAIAFSLVATLVVALRWYTRSRLVRIIGLDDYVILLSLVSRGHNDLARSLSDSSDPRIDTMWPHWSCGV